MNVNIANPLPSSEPFSCPLETGTIAGRISGPPDGIPVLALHGWLDNAASFELLAGLLPQLRILAIDMPGHGLSSHRSADAGYQIWDDLPQLRDLLDRLQWESCVMLGHSRGAMISTLLAATSPSRVRALITLDGMLPFPADDKDAVDQIRSYLDDRDKLSRSGPKIFASVEDFVARRSRAGEPPEIARKLASRALKKTGEGYEFRVDPRLSGASALKLNAGQLTAVLKALEMPVLNIWASPHARYGKLMEAARVAAATHVRDLTTHTVEGHHHWHMEEEPAASIARLVSEFIAARL